MSSVIGSSAPLHKAGHTAGVDVLLARVGVEHVVEGEVLVAAQHDLGIARSLVRNDFVAIDVFAIIEGAYPATGSDARRQGRPHGHLHALAVTVHGSSALGSFKTLQKNPFNKYQWI